MSDHKKILPGFVKDLEAAAPRSPKARRYLGPLDDGQTFPRDIPNDVLRGIGKAQGEADDLRRALIRLLWREVADAGGCVCEEGAAEPSDGIEWDMQLTDTCQAMRALGWGQHWDAEEFQKRAMREAPKARPEGAK